MFSSTFQIFLIFFNKNYYNLTLYSNFSTLVIFFEEMEPMFEIHFIFIATDDDILHIGDGVNIYPVTIINLGNCLNCLDKTIVSNHILVNILRLIWKLPHGY